MNLQVEGPVDDPNVTGRLVLRKGTLDMASFQTVGTKSQPVADLRLDVDVQVNQAAGACRFFLGCTRQGAAAGDGTGIGSGIVGSVDGGSRSHQLLGDELRLGRGSGGICSFPRSIPSYIVVGDNLDRQHDRGATTQRSSASPRSAADESTALPQQEILALLEWPGQLARINSGDIDLMELLQQGITMGLVGGVEDAVRESLGLDDFRLEPDLSQKRIRLSVGKALLPRIYLTYEQSLFSEPQGELTLEYDLENGWRLSAGGKKRR